MLIEIVQVSGQTDPFNEFDLANDFTCSKQVRRAT